MMQWEGLDLDDLLRLHPAWRPAGSPEAGYTARDPADPRVVLRHSDALMLSFMIRRAGAAAPPGSRASTAAAARADVSPLVTPGRGGSSAGGSASRRGGRRNPAVSRAGESPGQAAAR